MNYVYLFISVAIFSIQYYVPMFFHLGISYTAIGCIPHPHRIIILRCKLGALNARVERGWEEETVSVSSVKNVRSGSGGGRGGVTCSPSPSLWRHSSGSMRGEPQQQRSARRPSSPIHYNTHSPAPAVLHPCFLLHFRMTDRL